MQIIEKYNFRPNALARSLSDTKRKALGIVMPDIKNPFYAHLFTCCAQVAHTYGYSMLLEITMNNQELEAEYLSFFDEQQTDAIILVGGQVDNPVSYTHLDVYKRQYSYCASSAASTLA